MMLTLSGRRAARANRSAGQDPRRLPAWLFTAMLGLLAGCSETSLNDAPVVDLSVSSRAPTVKPPPMAIPAAPGEVIYTVKKGDTLFHLASVAGATMADLARWNGIDERAPIFVGQQLRLQAPPGGAESAASAGADAAMPANADTGSPGEAVATPVPLGGGGGVETRALDALGPAPAPAPTGTPTAAAGLPAATGSPVPAVPAVGEGAPVAPAPVAPATGEAAPPVPPAEPPPAPAAAPEAPAVPAPGPTGGSAAGWIWPVDGTVTAKFDPMRKGIEIAAAEDAPVVAVADGTVSYVGSPRDYGNLVILKHGDDMLSVYAHAKTLLVKEGQSVRRGQTIATAGKTPGMPATLHFEVRRNSIAIDPLDVLPIR